MHDAMKGLYPVLPIPFDKSDEVSYVDLESMVDFAVKCGVQGITINDFMSEFFMLTDAERKKVVETVCKRAQDKIPVIVGTTGTTPMLTCYWSEHAQDLGAHAVMCAQPYLMPYIWPDQYERGYKIMAQRVHVPVILQNTPADKIISVNINAPFGRDQAVALMKEFEIFQYFKDDSTGIQVEISRFLKAAEGLPKGAYKGFFTGTNGSDMYDNYLRGATGFMPALHMAEYREQIWTDLEAGNMEKAQQLQFDIAPLDMFDRMYMMDVCKRILKYQGVIEQIENRRANMPPFNSITEKELDRLICYLKEKVNFA